MAIINIHNADARFERSERSEEKIRDAIMSILYQRIGVQGSWQGSGKTGRFEVHSAATSSVCSAEATLDYALPNGETLSHSSDILLTISSKAMTGNSLDTANKYVSIEIKHKSAVTDQFKCRSFDMINMKKTYGPRLRGIMVFVRAGQGLSFKKAKAICYPFDVFFGIESAAMSQPEVWNDLIGAITDF